MAATYELFKDTPIEKTCIFSEATAKEIEFFARKKALQLGVSLSKNPTKEELDDFFQKNDYILVEKVKKTKSSIFNEKDFVYNPQMLITKVKIGKEKEKRPPVHIEFSQNLDMDIDYTSVYTDNKDEHEPTDDFIKCIRGLEDLVFILQDFLAMDIKEHMTVTSISMKYKSDEFEDNKILSGCVISYQIWQEDLMACSCGNTPFVWFDSYLERVDDKTGKRGISRDWETKISKIAEEAQKYMRGNFKNTQLSIMDAINAD